MSKVSILVFIKNILISLGAFYSISLATHHLEKKEFIEYITLLLVFNLQNSLYEGLFSLHILPLDKGKSMVCLYKQRKYIFLFSLFSSLMFFLYSLFVINVVLSIYISIFSFILLILGLWSLSITNIYCDTPKYKNYFMVDILFIIFSYAILYFISNKMYAYLFLLLSRNVGSSILYLKEVFLNVTARSKCIPAGKIYSYSFFSATMLAVIRDSIFPLAVGSFVGTEMLSMLRVFNTTLSAPGLLANSMNKIAVKILTTSSNRIRSYIWYVALLYFIVLSYCILWLCGGEQLSKFIFADKMNFSFYAFSVSLILFSIFWPLGQLLIITNLVNGNSRSFFQMSIVWTCVAIINFIILLFLGFEVFMLSFGLFQTLNFIMVFYFMNKDINLKSKFIYFFNKARRFYFRLSIKFFMRKDNFPTIISSNCVGNRIYRSYGMKYNTPTVGLWFDFEDFYKFVNNLDDYLSYDLVECHDCVHEYPVGILNDIKINFMHYPDFETARNKWNERIQRINVNNIIIFNTDRDGCTPDGLFRLHNACPYPIISFVNKEYQNIKNGTFCVVSKYEKQSCVGDLYTNYHELSFIFPYNKLRWK